MLRATTPCTFSTSQLPKVVRSWGVLCFFASKCASRRNGVQLFISHLARWLRTRRFSEPTFGPSGATNHWKNSVSRLCYLFAHLRLLSSDLFSSDSSPCWLLFHLSILSEVWLLNFLRTFYNNGFNILVSLNVYISVQRGVGVLRISRRRCNSIWPRHRDCGRTVTWGPEKKYRVFVLKPMVAWRTTISGNQMGCHGQS